MTTWPNGESYTGYRFKGSFTGWGTYIDSQGKRYRGLFCNGRCLFRKHAPKPGSQFAITGKQQRQYATYRYEGEFRDGIWDGYGVADWNDGCHYEGDFKNDMMHGYGIVTWPNGYRYEGQWQFDRQHGHGKYTCAKHDFEGEFAEGKRHGKGVSQYKSGDVCEATYVNDKRHGSAVWHFADGTKLFCQYEQGDIVGTGEKRYYDGSVYKGELSKNGLPHGNGVWVLADGSRYEGEHDMGFRHGKGVLYLADGTRQAGRFEKDCYIGAETAE